MSESGEFKAAIRYVNAEAKRRAEIAELEFKIGRYTYQIIQQGGRHVEYAVKVIERQADGYNESYWLKHPDPRFETTGGAMYAILLHLQDKGE